MLQRETNNNSPFPPGKAQPWVSLGAVLPSGLGWVGGPQRWVLAGDPAEGFVPFALLLQLETRCLAQPRKARRFRLRLLPLLRSAVI